MSYAIGVPTLAPKNTTGIAAFKTFRDAKMFMNPNDSLKLFIAEATPIDGNPEDLYTCKLCLCGRLLYNAPPGLWPPGTVLCDTLTIQTQVPFDNGEATT